MDCKAAEGGSAINEIDKSWRWLTIWPVLLIIGVIGYIFREAFFPPFPSWVLSRETGDVSTLYYYWRSFGFESLRSGIIPLWNPNIFCGTPFAAYPEAALFYPLNLIFILLPLPSALNGSFVLHLFLLAIFQYYWIRFLGSGRRPALLGSLILVFSGPVILHLTAGHLSNICTIAWVPLLFLLTEGFLRTRKLKWAVGLGLIAGIQILAGHWQYVYYTGLGLSVYGLGRLIIGVRLKKGEGKFLAVGVVICLGIALGLAAIQILPALSLSGDSFRKELDIRWASAFSLPPINLITFVLPGYLGDTISSLYRGRYYFWEMCGYLGFIPLVLALFALLLRKDRLALLIALLTTGALIVSLGSYTPVFKLLYDFFPGFRYFRGSAKSLFLVTFFISTLAGRGLDCLTSFSRTEKEKENRDPAPRFSRRGYQRFIIISSGLLLVISLAALFFSSSSGDSPPPWWRERLKSELLKGPHYDIVPPGRPLWWQQLMRETPPEKNYPSYIRRLIGDTPFPENSWRTFREGLVRLGWTLLIFSLLLAGAGLLRRRKTVITTIITILAAGEVIFWARPYITGFDSRTCLWDDEIKTFFREQDKPFRYLSIDPADYNRGMLNNRASILGYQADATRRYLEYINISQGLPPEPRELVPVITGYSRLLDLMNTRYIITPFDMEPPFSWFKRELTTQKSKVWSNYRSVPRVLIASRARVVTKPLKILKILNRTDYRPTEEVVLEESPPKIFLTGNTNPGSAKIEKSGNREVIVRARLTSPGILLLNDSYSPDWNAYVDGKEEEIYRANYLMRAVCLETGNHTVRFLYQPPSFTIGALISLGILSILIISLLVAILRSYYTGNKRKP
ncbi:MAG: YfhO family protein [Candidatus Auribacterota bacterium]|nr:YfhO family protein [Candidatus Auribacterota bacterium]